MTDSTVAIVGSGIAATSVAYALASRGIDVVIFEKGPEYPYPYALQYEEEVLNQWINPARDLRPELRPLVQTGNLPFLVDSERRMRVGGMATSWNAITLRMIPSDFQTRTRFGRGQDWPITYDELEPYYGQAERLLGVSGTDDDNPFAPPRSQPYPLPPFELGYFDRILGERLRDGGIVLHTTPQARTRLPYADRPACVNYGNCYACPIGARYSPAYHLQLALQTGFCRLYTEHSVRRVVVDASGQARALLVRDNNSAVEWEHSARVFVLAAGAIETIRLLFLSAGERHPDGLGNAGGQLGKRLSYHPIRYGLLRYSQAIYPGRAGFPTAQSLQFIDHPDRGRYGGIKIEFGDQQPRGGIAGATFAELDDLRNAADFFLHTRWMWLHAETDMTDQKYVALSNQRDPFGDPAPHVHHEASDFDFETYQYGRRLFERIAEATEATGTHLQGFEGWVSWSHHMGGCRMGTTPDDSVVNAFGQVHGVPNLFTAGASQFVETSAVNPTLTIVALALRTADYLLDQRL